MAREGTVIVRVLGEIRDLSAKLRLGAGEIQGWAGGAKNTITHSFSEITSFVTSRFGVMGREAQKGLDRIAASAVESGSAVGLGVAAGAAVAAAGLVKLGIEGVKSFVNLATEVRQFQRVSGATAEDSSRMVAVLKLLGLSADDGARGMFRLSLNAQQHADALAKDGVAIARNGRGQVDLLATLLNVGDAYKKAGAGLEGNTIAADAFGARVAQKLIPILALSADQIREFWAAAENHGEILSQDDLEKARQFKISLRELEAAQGDLERALGQDLVPALADLADKATTVLDTTAHLTRRIGGLAGIAKAAVAGFVPFGGVLGLIGGRHKKAAEMAQAQADALDALGESLAEAKAASDAYDATLKELNVDLAASSAASDETAALRDMGIALGVVADITDRAARATRTFQDAEEDLVGSTLDAEQSALSLQDQIDGLNQTIGAGPDFSRAGSVAATYAAHQRDVSQGVLGVIDATRKHVDAQARAGTIADTAQARKAAEIEQLRELERRYPAFRGEFEKYIALEAKLPNLATSATAAVDKQATSKKTLADATQRLIGLYETEAAAIKDPAERYAFLLGKINELIKLYPTASPILSQYVALLGGAASSAAAIPADVFTGGGGGQFGGHGVSGNFLSPGQPGAVKAAIGLTQVINLFSLNPKDVAKIVHDETAWLLRRRAG